MKPLVVCILTRAEGELLRENIKHHIYHEGVKHFIVTNHVTIEENKAVLAEFGDYIVKQFDEPVELHPFPQDQWRTRMCRYAMRHCDPAWLVLADTDEFWFGLQRLYTVPSNVNSVDCRNVLDHYGTKLDPDGGWLPQNLPWYERRKDIRRFGKTLHRGIDPGITITNKSHKPVLSGKCVRNWPGISQHHYFVRDWERFLLKVNTAGENRMPTARRPFWRRLQRNGKLREWWERTQQPTGALLEKGIRNGTIGYFAFPTYGAADQCTEVTNS
jgi:hypothetical protein